MIDLSTLGAAKKETSSGHIRDTNAQTFEKDVMHASMQKPVVVDFWAPWCGPCRQLMPVLEKAVNDAGGDVVMVKINIDENPELAAALRVQSVPMVYAFFQGQPVDGFVGARPESEIKNFIAKLRKLAGVNDDGAEKTDAAIDVAPLLAAADAFFRDGKTDDAIAAYSTVLDAAPDNMDAMAGIGWCLMAQGEMLGVADILGQIEGAQKNHPRIKGLQFVMDKGADAQGERPAAPEKPGDFYNLALHNLREGNVAGAIDALVDLTRLNREWQEQKARKLLLELFDAMGNAHPLVSAGRRKLSAVLFS